MAGRGPVPKDPKLRQRRNKPTTAARFETAEQPITEPPDLGDHPTGDEWHKRTREWWLDVWASPMKDEFMRADVDGLCVLAVLVDGFWREPSKELAAEIRLQRQCYGLTPMDRRRLQWEIVRLEAEQKKPKRPARKRPGDPRDALRIA